MYFSEVVEVFEQISQVSSRIEITKYLAALYRNASAQEIQILCNLSLGLLRPPYKGNQFNFAEKNLLNVVTQLLGASEKEIKEQSKKMGDLGLVVATLGTWKSTHKYTVEQVYADLCTLEEVSGKGSSEEKSEQILTLLKKVSPFEAKYIIRIILGILRLGFSDMTIIDALSWMEVGR